MAELRLQVILDSTLPVPVEGAINFETGAFSGPFLYDHTHGDMTSQGALTKLFEDLAYGVPLPLTFFAPVLHDIDAAVAVALFLQRDLLVHPSTPAFVNAVDLFHRYGAPMLAHVPREMGRFFYLLRDYLPTKGMAKAEIGDRLTSIVTWIREYLLEGRLPHLGAPAALPKILDHGTNGFVVAETPFPSPEAWIEVYRQGFLRGLLVSPEVQGERRVLAARKSPHIIFDLDRAAMVLNEVERTSGGSAEWRVRGLLLHGPPRGTAIPLPQLLHVFIRS